MTGAILGYVASIFTAQVFYNTFDAEGTLPSKVIYVFHARVPAVLITAPTILFSAVSVSFAGLKLRKKPLDLIHDTTKITINRLTKKRRKQYNNRPFIKELGTNMLFSSLRLIFFVGFAAFIFAALVQIAFTMNGIEGAGGLLLPVLFGGLGIVIGFTTLLFALSFIIKRHKKYLAILGAYGYTLKECNKAVFGGYRVVSYVGFSIGTLYQHFYMKMMIGVFADGANIPEINFSIMGFAITFIVFFFAYEMLMLLYKRKISKIPLRKIMQAN